MSFAEELKKVMEEYKLEIKDVSKACATSKGTVTRWLNDYTHPHPIIQPAIIEELKKLGTTGNR